MTEFTFKDISIENNGEHFELWNSHKDNYLTGAGCTKGE